MCPQNSRDGVAESDWLTERTKGWVCSWREYLMQDDGRDAAETLRRNESTGRPLGDQVFLKKIGQLLGRELVPKKPGPKAAKQKNLKKRKES